MAARNSLSRKSVFKTRRYWYHISSTLKHKSVLLKPYGNIPRGFNRSDSEPDVPRICVAPSIAHCLTAVPYCPADNFVVYRTKSPVRANSPFDVFDANVTLEGWIQKPTVFVRLGRLDLEDVERGERIDHVKNEAASDSTPGQSGKLLRWWKKVNPRKYVKRY